MPSDAWQKKCTSELLRCVALGARGSTEWQKQRLALVAEAARRLPAADARIVIADCDLRGAQLAGWEFDHCYITRTDFTDADLTGANFDRAMLRGCRLVRANLCGAKLTRTSVDSACLAWSVKINRRTYLAVNGTADNLSGFDSHFRRRAEEDQRIFDVRNSDQRALRAWLWLIDYGRSVWRVAALLTGIAILFGSIYLAAYGHNPKQFDDGTWNPADIYLMSFQRILNADAALGGTSLGLQIAFFLESAVGFGALALLAAVLLRKISVLE